MRLALNMDIDGAEITLNHSGFMIDDSDTSGTEQPALINSILLRDGGSLMAVINKGVYQKVSVYQQSNLTNTQRGGIAGLDFTKDIIVKVKATISNSDPNCYYECKRATIKHIKQIGA